MHTETAPKSQPSERLDRIAGFLLDRPSLAIVFLLLCFLAGLALLPFLKNESGVQVYLDPKSPYLAVLDEVNEEFVNDDLLYVGYEVDDVFSVRALELIRALGDAILVLRASGSDGSNASVLLVEEVTSIASVKELVGSELQFRTVPLVAHPVPRSELALEWIRERALNNPLIAGHIVTDDLRRGLLVIRLAPNLEDDLLAYAVGSIRALLLETEQVEGISFQLAGEIASNADIARYQQEDLARFVPLVYLVITLMLFVFLRRLRGVVLTLLCISIALVSAMGLLVAVGGTLTNVAVMLPPVILTLSVAMLVHYQTEYGKNALSVRDSAARHTLRDLLPPVFIAALTTSVAMACLAISRTPAVRYFALTASLALLVCFLICLFFCAAAWRKWDAPSLISPHGLALSARFDAFLTALAQLIIRRPRLVLIASLLFLVLVGVGATRVVVDQSPMAMFSKSAPISVSTDFIDEHFGGVTTLIASIRAPHEGYFLEPSSLEQLDELSTYLREGLGATRITGPHDYLKLMHRELFDGAPKMHRNPATRDQAEQLLLLNSDDTVGEYINASRDWVRIVARTSEQSTMALAAAHERLELFLKERYPANSGFVTHATGQSRLWATMLRELLRTQIVGLGLSFLLIFLLLLLLFRSPLTALFSVLPNCFPIIIALGVMGWIGIHLNSATVLISTMALGIAIDDTVHFLQHLRAEIRSHGDTQRGVLNTMRVKGPAIIGTSLIITAGFAVLLASNFVPTRDFALIICVAMMAALIGDLLLLPAMVLVTKTRLGVMPRNMSSKELSPSAPCLEPAAIVLARVS